MMKILGGVVTVIGGVIAFGSVIMGAVAPTAAQTLIWLAPEIAGCLVLVLGLHAWIGASADSESREETP